MELPGKRNDAGSLLIGNIVLHLKTDEMYLSDPYCIDCLQSGKVGEKL